MKPSALLLLGALALCAQDKTAVVTGSVVNSVTGAGIDGATVTLVPGSKNNDRIEGVTDAAGNFRVGGLKPGEYIPLARKPGFFLPLSTAFGGQSVHISASEDAPPLRFELIPPARIRGRVVGADGQPAARVEVALGGPNYGITATTDENGDFIFQDLQPGSYGLMAKVKRARTYFPSASDAALAERVTVTGGAEQSGYEIRLQPARRTFRVRGLVLDAGGKPAPKTVVEPLPASGIGATGGLRGVSAGMTTFSISSHPTGVSPESEDPTVTGPDGVFEFPTLPEGDWIFRVESEHLVHAVAQLAVHQDIDDLTIRLESPVNITGTVTLSDGSPAPNGASVFVGLNSVDGTPSAGAPSDKGALEFKNVAPGRFRIYATPPMGRYYVVSVMVGATDATNQPVSLNAASPPIRVILKPGSTISGTVEKGEGASVLLVPQTLAPGDIGWLRECGVGGSFEFAGLPPGEYYAVATTRVDLRTLQGFTDLERLQVLVRDATAVRVDEGAAASVQLKPPR